MRSRGLSFVCWTVGSWLNLRGWCITLLHSSILKGTLNGLRKGALVQVKTTAPHVSCHSDACRWCIWFYCVKSRKMTVIHPSKACVKAQLSCNNVSASFYIRLLCGWYRFMLTLNRAHAFASLHYCMVHVYNFTFFLTAFLLQPFQKSISLCQFAWNWSLSRECRIRTELKFGIETLVKERQYWLPHQGS